MRIALLGITNVNNRPVLLKSEMYPYIFMANSNKMFTSYKKKNR